ncbi:ABC transporter permease [Corynebacterium qintianiae]|uniref:ABC transporter permease n=1 Tax=Corynebacterium qintianiae TaxID=2709392 RepID=A0A7T0PF08_9CORY|nr:ABC transporter permease [Corynebacterium qintianiae]QPK83791.1 ABC transporter permease [Corynebacterium qintianiae]
MSALVAAARPVIRDFANTKLRILAAVMLIALPVGFAAFAIVRDASASHATVRTSMGNSVTLGGERCEQSINGYESDCSGTPRELAAADAVNAEMPDGLRAELSTRENVVLTSGSGGTSSMVSVVPPSLIAQGIPVPGAGEIVVSRTTADILDLSVGDPVFLRWNGVTADLTVKAVSPGWSDYVTPDVWGESFNPSQLSSVSWQIVGDRPVTWDDVIALNEHGYVVSSEDVMNNPPSPDRVYEQFRDGSTGPSATAAHHLSDALLTIVVLGIPGILILLFISPVFTLALNRHTRMFSLMAAQGASPRHIRLAVLASGGLLGLAGSTIGAVAGTVASIIAWLVQFPGWDLMPSWPSLALAWAFGIAGSAALAGIPAIMASRTAIPAGIKGGASDRMLRWRWWMLIGPVLLVLTAGAWVTVEALHYFGRDTQFEWQSTLVLTGLIGLIASSPAVLFGTARAASRGSLAVRLAGRGMLRRSLHSLPALAALLVISCLFTTFHVGVHASSETQLAAERLVNTSRFVGVTPVDPAHAPAESVAAAEAAADSLHKAFGGAQPVELRGVPYSWDSKPGDVETLELAGYPRCAADSVSDYRRPSMDDFHNTDGTSAAIDPQAADDCHSLMMRYLSDTGTPASQAGLAIVQGPEDLGIWEMSRDTREEAKNTLARGGILVPRGMGLDGTDTDAEVIVTRTSDGKESRAVTAFAALDPRAGQTMVLSREAAEALDVPVHLLAYLVPVPDDVSQAEVRRITERVGDDMDAAGEHVNISFSSLWTGVPRWMPAGAMTLIASMILLMIIALAAVGVRRDSVALQSVGATPSLTARIAAAQMVLLSGAGLGAGLITGHLAAWVIASESLYDINGNLLRIGSQQFIRPGWELILAALAVTCAAGLVSWVAHRGEPDDLTQRRG